MAGALLGLVPDFVLSQSDAFGQHKDPYIVH